MTHSDLLQVARIERSTFPDPWPLNSFSECLWYGHRCHVIEEEDKVQAYGIMSLQADNAHILNLCVRPSQRRRGVGRQMLTYLLETADEARVESIFLEVRISNLPAIRLYASAGFTEIGLRKGYYPGHNGREDALVLVRKASASAEVSQ